MVKIQQAKWLWNFQTDHNLKTEMLVIKEWRGYDTHSPWKALWCTHKEWNRNSWTNEKRGTWERRSHPVRSSQSSTLLVSDGISGGRECWTVGFGKLVRRVPRPALGLGWNTVTSCDQQFNLEILRARGPFLMVANVQCYPEQLCHFTSISYPL